MANPSKQKRPLYVIANEIRKDWGSKVNYAAKPYLDAMSQLNHISDRYIMETASEQVARFLCNATTWRGEVARRVKKELNAML